MLSQEPSPSLFKGDEYLYEVVYSRNWANDVYGMLKIKAGPDFARGYGTGIVVRGNGYKLPGQIIQAYEVQGLVRRCRLNW